MCFFYLHANYFDLSAKGLQLARCKEGLCSQRHVVHAVKTCLFFYIRFISVECQLDAQTLMSEMYLGFSCKTMASLKIEQVSGLSTTT